MQSEVLKAIQRGLEHGYVFAYNRQKSWYEVRFPDGSFEVIRGQDLRHKDVAIIAFADRLWKRQEASVGPTVGPTN